MRLDVITDLKIAEDGVLLYQSVLGDGTLNRFSLIPGVSTVGHPEEIVRLADSVWTPEFVFAYKMRLAAEYTEKGASV